MSVQTTCKAIGFTARTGGASVAGGPVACAVGRTARMDAAYGGPGAIWATVAPDATQVGVIDPVGSAERPLARRVILFDRRNMTPVRSTISDPATGAYRFDRLRTDIPFLIMADDFSGAYNAVVADWQYAR